MGAIELSKYNFEVPYQNNVIVYNSVTDTYAIFDAADYKKFKENPCTYIAEEKDDDKISSLWRGGFLVVDSETEYLRVKAEFFKKAYNSSVFNATIIPTNACNLACSYCFAPRTKETMSWETVRQVIMYFKDLFEKEGHNIKHFNVKWFGGEPMLCCKQIEKISLQLIEMCNSIGAEYHACIYTNLTMLDDELCRAIKKSHIETIHTTIDGMGEINDLRRPAKNGKPYFDKLIANICKVREFSNVKILVNIDKRNKDEINSLIDFLLQNKIVDGTDVEIGFNLINDNEYIHEKEVLLKYDCDETNNMIDSFLAKLGTAADVSLPTEALNCFAMAHNSVVIDPEGNLKKCSLGQKYGSVYDSVYNFEELYFVQSHNPFLKKNCVNCPIFPRCYGGCTHNNGEICTIKHLLATRIRRYFDFKLDI